MSKSIGYIIIADSRPLVLCKNVRGLVTRFQRYGVLYFPTHGDVTLFRSRQSAKGAIKRTNEERRQYNIKYGHGDVTFEAEFGKCSIYRVESEL